MKKHITHTYKETPFNLFRPLPSSLFLFTSTTAGRYANRVAVVLAGSPAEEAGLRKNDVSVSLLPVWRYTQFVIQGCIFCVIMLILSLSLFVSYLHKVDC